MGGFLSENRQLTTEEKIYHRELVAGPAPLSSQRIASPGFRLSNFVLASRRTEISCESFVVDVPINLPHGTLSSEGGQLLGVAY